MMTGRDDFSDNATHCCESNWDGRDDRGKHIVAGWRAIPSGPVFENWFVSALLRGTQPARYAVSPNRSVITTSAAGSCPGRPQVSLAAFPMTTIIVMT